jgi:O-antigen/teichoic acid export membrane protein
MIKQKRSLKEGAIIFFIFINLFNLLNFIFNFLMGRMLGPENYGVLAALMSIVAIYSIPGEIIQNIISKYTTRFKEENSDSRIKYAAGLFLKKGTILSFLLFILLGGASLFLSDKLGINYFLLIATNIFVFFAFINPVGRGVLQGKKRFERLGFTYLIEGFVKLLTAILLVYLGFRVLGAIVGVIFGVAVSGIVSLYFCRELIKPKAKKTDLKEIKIGPYFIIMGALAVFLSLDIILAKYFLPPKIAGQYAAISLIGKVIYVGISSITRVMFPIASEKQERDQNTKAIFNQSILIAGILGIIGTAVYFAFSTTIISFLYGAEYLEISKYLVYSGIAFLILSIANINFMYALSINKTRGSWLALLGIIMQIILFFAVPHNLNSFLIALILSSITMFILSFLLLRLWKKQG